MATEHNPVRTSLPFPQRLSSFLPPTTKTSIGFNPLPTPLLSSVAPLFSVICGRRHTRLLSGISNAHPSRPDGSVSPGSSHCKLKRTCGYSPPLHPQPPRLHCFLNILNRHADVFMFSLLTKRETRGISEAKINKHLLFSWSHSAFKRAFIY